MPILQIVSRLRSLMYQMIDNVLKKRADALPAPERGRPVQLVSPSSILPQPPRVDLLLVRPKPCCTESLCPVRSATGHEIVCIQITLPFFALLTHNLRVCCCDAPSSVRRLDGKCNVRRRGEGERGNRGAA